MADDCVLVVERNPRIGTLIAGELKDRGFFARTVRHGADAAWELRRQLYHLICIDSHVSMGGVKTARLLRLHPTYRSIPVLLFLPPDRDQAVVTLSEARRVGLGEFLVKPFTSAALSNRLQQVLHVGPTPAKAPSQDQIRKEIRSLSDLPAMPAAHNRLFSLLSVADDEIDIREVAFTIDKDPALTATVMRVSRSAFFGFKGSAMRDAVAYLGVTALRRIVQSVMVYNVIGSGRDSDDRFPMGDLWRHSLAAGLAMEIMGKADKKKIFFSLGLLHDIGKAVLMLRFPDYYRRVLDLVEREHLSIHRAEQELLGITHAECGAELALHWRLPGEVHTAIAAHHNPDQALQHKRLAAMAHVADVAVRTMGIGSGGDGLVPVMSPLGRRLQKDLGQVLDRKESIVQQVQSIMGDGGES